MVSAVLVGSQQSAPGTRNSSPSLCLQLLFSAKSHYLSDTSNSAHCFLLYTPLPLIWKNPSSSCLFYLYLSLSERLSFLSRLSLSWFSIWFHAFLLFFRFSGALPRRCRHRKIQHCIRWLLSERCRRSPRIQKAGWESWITANLIEHCIFAIGRTNSILARYVLQISEGPFIRDELLPNFRIHGKADTAS